MSHRRQYTDTESGLIYVRNRYYDPATGQFLSRDPLAAFTGPPCGYVDGNPLNEADPFGLFGLGSRGLSGQSCNRRDLKEWARRLIRPPCHWRGALSAQRRPAVSVVPEIEMQRLLRVIRARVAKMGKAGGAGRRRLAGAHQIDGHLGHGATPS